MNFKESALVLIDLQKESNFGLQEMEQVITNSKDLIDNCRNVNIPIIYTRQINRADGIALSKGEPLNEDGTPFYYTSNSRSIEVFDEIKPQENDIIIDKYRWSAFYGTSLDLTLKSLGVKQLIIGGVVTDGCLMTSVFDAYFRDYNVHLIKDICAASNDGAHMASLMMLANWVYTIEIYDTRNFVKRIKEEDFTSWKPNHPDSLQFTPENMREMYNQLETQRKG